MKSIYNQHRVYQLFSICAPPYFFNKSYLQNKKDFPKNITCNYSILGSVHLISGNILVVDGVLEGLSVPGGFVTASHVKSCLRRDLVVDLLLILALT
jgi:hypothetical protein